MNLTRVRVCRARGSDETGNPGGTQSFSHPHMCEVRRLWEIHFRKTSTSPCVNGLLMIGRLLGIYFSGHALCEFGTMKISSSRVLGLFPRPNLFSTYP